MQKSMYHELVILINKNIFLQKYFTIDGRNLGSKHVSQKSLQDKKLLHGVKQFNLDAKNGLEYLSKSGILNKTSAKEVSLFVCILKKTPRAVFVSFQLSFTWEKWNMGEICGLKFHLINI